MTSAFHKWLLLAVLFALPGTWLPAQEFNLEGFDLGSFGGQQESADPVTVQAEFTPATDDRPAVLMITAKMDPGWHIYSITQPAGGPLATVITLDASPAVRKLAKFRPFPEPHKHVDKVAWKGLTLEEHEGQVTWYVPVEIAEGTPLDQLTISGNVRLQACKEQCLPPTKYAFEAKIGQGVEIGPLPEINPAAAVPPAPAKIAPPPNAAVYKADGSVVTWYSWVEATPADPNTTALIRLRASLPPSWHVYAYQQRDLSSGSKPTLITMQPTRRLDFGPVESNSPIVEKTLDIPGFEQQRYHDEQATWTIPVIAKSDTPAASHSFEGIIGYQACESTAAGLGTCELVQGVKLVGSVDVASGNGSVSFQPASYLEASKLADSQAEVAPAGLPEAIESAVAEAVPALPATTELYDLEKINFEGDDYTLGGILLLAFLGGVVLNLMPCVLPVIGLKVMSFVSQAGKSRSQALLLNLWYSLGILAVFWILGGLAVFAGLTWGGQFGSTPFNVVMVSIVFAMALSLLGVWEIPIPGFLGSGVAQEATQQEGPVGALLKGAVTTVLATPCTGPGMAVALGWAVRQPPSTTMLTFTVLGLGMAFPYLLIGAFPKLVAWLPKPGNWMVTFKQLMGFILLGTVLFLMATLHPAVLIPTLALLTGIGFACWWVNRTPAYDPLPTRIQSWAIATAIVAGSVALAFPGIYRKVTLPRYEAQLSSYSDKQFAERADGILQQIAAADSEQAMRSELNQIAAQLAADSEDGAWQPFTLARLGRVAVQENRTVLVDFSAEWCVNCKALEAAVLHTEPVEQAIDEHEVVTMYADFTHQPPEIANTIRALNSNGVPVIAIFPGDRPYQPIVFRGSYTQDSLVEAIKRATGGQAASSEVASASSSGLR